MTRDNRHNKTSRSCTIPNYTANVTPTLTRLILRIESKVLGGLYLFV